MSVLCEEPISAVLHQALEGHRLELLAEAEAADRLGYESRSSDAGWD